MQMWGGMKVKRVTSYATVVLVAMLLIGGTRPAMSQMTDDGSGGNVASSPLQAGTDQSIPGWVNVGGVARTYHLYVPRTFRPDYSALIIGLHGRGRGGPGTAMEQYSELDFKADREGFAVAYLDGLDDAPGTLNWNYYYDFFFVCGPDDVGFVRTVIDLLKQQLRPDPRRIYVAGTSAGGFMAQRVGVELSVRVAAIGVVQGELYLLSPSSPPSIPDPVAPISVLFLKGDQDPNNQY